MEAIKMQDKYVIIYYQYVSLKLCTKYYTVSLQQTSKAFFNSITQAEDAFCG